MKPTWIVAFTVAIASANPVVFAQSIVDVARLEEARRASVRTPSRVYTNANLAPADKPSGREPGHAPPSVAAAPAIPGNSSPTAAEPAPVEAPAPVVLDEKQWRSQAATLRARIAAARKDLAALDGATHTDPREQAMLEAIRKRRQAALAQAEEALRRFEMEADATQVPRAWLQEPGQ